MVKVVKQTDLRVADRCLLKRVTKTTDGKDFHYWGGEAYLDSVHPGNTTEEVREATAWAIKDEHDVGMTPRPTAGELVEIRRRAVTAS